MSGNKAAARTLRSKIAMPGQEVHITSNARKDLSVGAGNVPQGTKRKSLPNAKYGDSERSE